MFNFFGFNKKSGNSNNLNREFTKVENAGENLPIQQVTKVFTDREGPRQSFWDTYNGFKRSLETDEDACRVLMYYP